MGLKLGKNTSHSLFLPEVTIVNVHGDLTAWFFFNKIFRADSKKIVYRRIYIQGKKQADIQVTGARKELKYKIEI